MRRFGSLRGFISGVVVGALVGSAGMAAAAIGYKGWQAFSGDFRNGYISGFLDMANLARNLQPGGWVDAHYPYLPGVKMLEWRTKTDALYADPENQRFTVESLLQLVGHELGKEHGVVTAEQRQQGLLKMKLDAIRKKQIEEMTKKGVPVPSELTKPGSPKQHVAAPKTVPGSERHRPRKWCRCDGTNPKEARRLRKERRAQDAAKAVANPAGEQKPADAEKPSAAKAAPAPASPPPVNQLH
jgi:hypothetical protein